MDYMANKKTLLNSPPLSQTYQEHAMNINKTAGNAVCLLAAMLLPAVAAASCTTTSGPTPITPMPITASTGPAIISGAPAIFPISTVLPLTALPTGSLLITPPTANPTSTGNGKYLYAQVFNVIAPTDSSTCQPANFSSIAAALKQIPAIAQANACPARYLIKLNPGVYTEQVTMRPCVDIEGAGEANTTIASAGGVDYASATVTGAALSELRQLTVQNYGCGASGSANYNLAIYNSGAASNLTHVTVNAVGGSQTYGVFNNAASPTLTNVSVYASGMSPSTCQNSSSADTAVAGVVNQSGSAPSLNNAAILATGGVWNTALANDDASPQISASTLLAPTGTALANSNGSTAGIQNSILHGKTAIDNEATVNITASEIDGPLTGAGGVISCQNAYNGYYANLNASCQ